MWQKNVDRWMLPYIYISNFLELNKALGEIKEYVLKSHRIAVSVEGINLCRSGKIILVAVGMPNRAYLFDIISLGRVVFDSGLGEILEDQKVDKLWFDCRDDSDALWHSFAVKLNGVIDVNLLEIIRNSNKVSQKFHGLKRNQRSNEEKGIENLMACIYHYLNDAELFENKQQVANAGESSKAICEERLISHDLFECAANKVKTLFSLYDKMKIDDDGLNRLRLASSDFCTTKRSMVMRRYNKNLAINIIPMKGSFSLKSGNTKCNGCLRLFPYKELTTLQLRKRVQLCRVCKLVKGHTDEQNSYESSLLGPFPTVLQIKNKISSRKKYNDLQRFYAYISVQENQTVSPSAMYWFWKNNDSDADSELKYWNYYDDSVINVYNYDYRDQHWNDYVDCNENWSDYNDHCDEYWAYYGYLGECWDNFRDRNKHWGYSYDRHEYINWCGDRKKHWDNNTDKYWADYYDRDAYESDYDNCDEYRKDHNDCDEYGGNSEDDRDEHEDIDKYWDDYDYYDEHWNDICDDDLDDLDNRDDELDDLDNCDDGLDDKDDHDDHGESVCHYDYSEDRWDGYDDSDGCYDNHDDYCDDHDCRDDYSYGYDDYDVYSDFSDDSDSW